MYGQGECCLIRTRYNKVILVDSGEGHSEKYDNGKGVILPYLMAHKVSKIDYLVLSHYDLDHCGGAFYLLENIKIKNIVMGVQAEKYENCVEFLKIAKKKRINIIVLKAGQVLKLDKETHFETYFPEPTYTISSNKINNNSLVLKLVYKDFKMLFTGDIEEEAESYLANKYKDVLKADVLKVAHHRFENFKYRAIYKIRKTRICFNWCWKKQYFWAPKPRCLSTSTSTWYYNLSY